LLIAGIGLGLLFYTYFYFWTSATLALLLGLIVDLPRHKVYFHTGWIGGLIGLPSLLLDAAAKSASSTDWLHRSNKLLPISRFSELIIHNAIILYLIITLAWVWFRR